MVTLDTVLTCFPNSDPESTAGVELGKHDIVKSLLKYFNDPNKRRWIRSAQNLATCIADRCASNIFDQQLHGNEKFDFLGMFQHSLANIVCIVSMPVWKIFVNSSFSWEIENEHLDDLSNQYHLGIQMDEQSKLYTDMSRAVRNDDDEVGLKSGPEFRLLEEAKDILDELHIMRDINVQQNALLKTFYSLSLFNKTELSQHYLEDKPKERAEVIDETVKKAQFAHEAIIRLIDTKQRQTNLFQARSIKKLLGSNNKILDSANQTMQQSEKSGETLMVVSSLVKVSP